MPRDAKHLKEFQYEPKEEVRINTEKYAKLRGEDGKTMSQAAEVIGISMRQVAYIHKKLNYPKRILKCTCGKEHEIKG